MKIQETQIVMVSLLVLTLSLILPAHAGQTIKLEKNVHSNVSERKSGNFMGVSVFPAESDPSLEKHAVLTVAAQVKEKLKRTNIYESEARRATGGSKMYVENNVASTGQTAIRGEATAISAIGYDLVNYGGYFRAAGVGGRGVYGEASNPGAGTNYGGYFKAEGNGGRGVYGEASHIGGYFLAKRATNGIGVYASATGTYSDGVVGEGIGDNGRGVVGSGGQWDFYALNGASQYGPFTGGHEVRLSENFPEKPTPGMVVSVTGQAKVRKDKDGTIPLSSTLPTVMISAVPQDRTVFGVFVSESPLPKDHWYKAREGERFGTVNALGEGRVWVTNQMGEIQAGDYITASAIPGYGQRQNDDLLHSYTLGKAIETIDWEQVTEMVQHDGKTYKRYPIAVAYTSG